MLRGAVLAKNVMLRLLTGCPGLVPSHAEARSFAARGSVQTKQDAALHSLPPVSGRLTGLEAEEIPILAAAARWRLGQIIGGEAGDALRQQADQVMRAEGVCEPRRFVAVFVNGFAASWI